MTQIRDMVISGLKPDGDGFFRFSAVPISGKPFPLHLAARAMQQVAAAIGGTGKAPAEPVSKPHVDNKSKDTI